MRQNTLCKSAVLLVCLALAAGISGCRVRVDKGASGEDKNVRVDTPFGGIHVNTDQTTAADLGLQVYPGAQIVADKDDSKSADVHMGFGRWELRVKAVNYSVADSQDKVVAFYKKSLARYGDVLSCQDEKPVGAPAKTAEGLTCSDDGANVKVTDHSATYSSHPDDNQKGFELKAGSRRHQHVVAFKSSAPGQTRFSLIALDLPSEGNVSSGQSD
jgi:hypothetical protein